MIKNTEFPKSITLETIDTGLFNWVKEQNMTIGTKVIPVEFFTMERWAEFEKMWTSMDENKNVEFPIIGIVRTNITPNADRRYRIRNRNFITYRKPYYTNNGVGYEVYTIPQPIKIDLNYEIKILTHYIQDANFITGTFLKHFASLQAYLSIEDNMMPIIIQNIDDRSTKEDPKAERIFQMVFQVTVYGRLIDSSEFKIKKCPTDIIQVHILET